MTSPAPTVSLRKLSPYAGVVGLLFSVVSVLVLVAGYFDLQRSLEELPKRFIVSAVMTLAFAISFGIAAFISFKACVKLKRISDAPADQSLAVALDSLVQFLRGFFLWVAFFGVVIVVTILMPTY